MPSTALLCYSTNFMLFTSNAKLFSRELEILNYVEIRSFDWIKLIHSYQLINIDRLTDSNRLDDLTFNQTPWEGKHRVSACLIRAQTLQILSDSVHILTYALNNLCRPLWAAIRQHLFVKTASAKTIIFLSQFN